MKSRRTFSLGAIPGACSLSLVATWTFPASKSCRRSKSLPDGVDLAVVAVPAAELPAVVERLGERSARVCVILTAGLAETGASGVAAQRELARIARHHGMRLIGPNCFGVVSRIRGTRLDATFGTLRPEGGVLAIGSQSGGVGIDLLEHAADRDLGIASFVSLGNKVDVSGNDLLAAWTDDEAVQVGALYLESFGNPRKFVRLARTFSRTKPLLMVVGGKSEAGARAGGSHTAASATPARALEAMVRACGIVPVDDATELMDTAALLDRTAAPCRIAAGCHRECRRAGRHRRRPGTGRGTRDRAAAPRGTSADHHRVRRRCGRGQSGGPGRRRDTDGLPRRRRGVAGRTLRGRRPGAGRRDRCGRRRSVGDGGRRGSSGRSGQAGSARRHRCKGFETRRRGDAFLVGSLSSSCPRAQCVVRQLEVPSRGRARSQAAFARDRTSHRIAGLGRSHRVGETHGGTRHTRREPGDHRDGCRRGGGGTKDGLSRWW